MLAPYRAFVQVLARGEARGEARGNADGSGGGEEADWLVACRQLGARIERTGGYGVILDLGICTASEAQTAVSELLARLGALGVQARAGVGPSSCLAQLACRDARAQRPLVLVSAAQSQSFLRRIPVRTLVGLHPRGMISSEIVERLDGYGLRTLGHLARIDELALRRQFGAAGNILAALAQGQDALPFNPTPAPSVLRFHARFASPVSSTEALALLPHLAERIAGQLRRQERTASSLRLDLRWEDGRVERRRLTLRAYVDRPALLDQELRRLLIPLLREDRIEDRIEEIRVTLGDFAPLAPEQAAIWRTREQRMASIAEVAETAARRHGRVLLLRPQVVAPDSIFTEDRYALCTLADADFRSPPINGRDPAADSVRSPHAEKTDTATDAGVHSDMWSDMWSGVPQRLHWW